MFFFPPLRAVRNYSPRSKGDDSRSSNDKETRGAKSNTTNDKRPPPGAGNMRSVRDFCVLLVTLLLHTPAAISLSTRKFARGCFIGAQSLDPRPLRFIFGVRSAHFSDFSAGGRVGDHLNPRVSHRSHLVYGWSEVVEAQVQKRFDFFFFLFFFFLSQTASQTSVNLEWFRGACKWRRDWCGFYLVLFRVEDSGCWDFKFSTP